MFMVNTGKTINKRIFHSHLIIIVIFMLLTSVVFSLCLSVYVRGEAKKQLVTAGTLVKKSISGQLPALNNIKEARNIEREELRELLVISRTLKQTKSFVEINYAILSKKQNILLYPKDNNEESSLLQEHILPAIGKKKLAVKNSVFYFNAAGKRYAALRYPLDGIDLRAESYILIYSDMEKSRSLTSAVTGILFFILLITAVIASLISKSVSKKISQPVSLLSKYAQKIGDREYSTEQVKYEDDEIGQLAETMHAMAKKLSAYDNTIKTFMQNASHELRTPLMSIQGYAEGIKHGVVEDQESAVNIIIEESKRLSELVEDLLYLSKLDALQDTMNLEKIKVEDLLKSCIERINGIAVKNKKIITLSSGLSGIFLRGDEEKLIRAIINILGNCLRYAENQVEVFWGEEESGVVITIKDDGPGFGEKELSSIFDRFYKGKGGNHGLGLTIAKSIIEKHNGIITAGNNSEGGAFFRIVI